MRKVPHHGPCAEKTSAQCPVLLPSTVLPPCIPPLTSFPTLGLSTLKASIPSSALAHLTCALLLSTTPTHSLIACAPIHSLHQHTCLHSPTWLVHFGGFFTLKGFPPYHHHTISFSLFLHTWGLQRLHSTPSRGVSCLALRLR
jgi:hypothetical protein